MPSDRRPGTRGTLVGSWTKRLQNCITSPFRENANNVGNLHRAVKERTASLCGTSTSVFARNVVISQSRGSSAFRRFPALLIEEPPVAKPCGGSALGKTRINKVAPEKSLKDVAPLSKQRLLFLGGQ